MVQVCGGAAFAVRERFEEGFGRGRVVRGGRGVEWFLCGATAVEWEVVVER
jgi:hypothetical protein